ncbi:MAG: AMMECR1 domain-containing protein [Wenzhouxiangella sp.]
MACRLTLENHFRGYPTIVDDFSDVPMQLRSGRGLVYISLYNGVTLRGCRSSQSGSVLQAAIEATEKTIVDRRHGSRLKRSELDEVWIDINILLPGTDVSERNLRSLEQKIELGVHAVGIRKEGEKGRSSGANFKAAVPINKGYTLEILLRRLGRKAGLGREAWRDQTVRIIRYESLHFREQFTHRFRESGSQELYRGTPVVRQRDVTRQNLERAVHLAGNFLANHVTQRGRLTYEYDPQQSERRFSNRAVAVLRRLAATWILAEIGKFLGSPRMQRAARRSLAYLAERFFQTDSASGTGFLVVQDKAGIGTAGFMLSALSAVDDESFLPGVREQLARYILHLENREGGFFYPMSLPDRNFKFDSKQLYYPGEAMTGLMSLYSITEDKLLLEPLFRVLPYYRNLFRQHDGRINMAAWMAKPYAALYKATGDKEVGQFVLEVCDVVVERQLGLEQSCFDRIGGFSNRSNYCAAGVYLEAVAEGFPVAQSLNDQRRMHDYEVTLLLGMRFLLQGQYGSADVLQRPDARFLAGGFRTSPFQPVVRVDNVQHAACAILRTLQCLDLRYVL